MSASLPPRRRHPPTRHAVDVAIVGGGPAGSATALALRAHAPALRVALIEATAYTAPRLGETLPPLAGQLLQHLGVADAFAALAPRAVHGSRAAWGSDSPVVEDYLFTGRGAGWHLDRAAFDALLATEAARRGAALWRRRRLRELTGNAGAWRLALSRGPMLAARFVVDATGGAAVVARRCGAHPIADDRLVGLARFFDDPAGDPRILVEAFADGWWYTAGLPGGRRVACCFTDGDIAARLQLAELPGWRRALAATHEVAPSLSHARPRGRLLARAAATRRLDPVAGPGWLALGDAATIFDPLSSQGVVKALRGGIFAAYAIADELGSDERTATSPSGLDRYRNFVASEHASYLATRHEVYAAEQRWPDRPFWQRRHAS